MTTRYEYLSTCCNTSYMETRNESDPQVFATCVQCGQGEYQEINQIEIDLPDEEQN